MSNPTTIRAVAEALDGRYHRDFGDSPEAIASDLDDAGYLANPTGNAIIAAAIAWEQAEAAYHGHGPASGAGPTMRVQRAAALSHAERTLRDAVRHHNRVDDIERIVATYDPPLVAAMDR